VDAFLRGAWDILLALIPPIAVGGIFWIVMRAIIRADRTERKVYSKIEAEELAKIEAAKAVAAKGKASESKSK
jgi:hypothetical protein